MKRSETRSFRDERVDEDSNTKCNGTIGEYQELWALKFLTIVIDRNETFLKHTPRKIGNLKSHRTHG